MDNKKDFENSWHIAVPDIKEKSASDKSKLIFNEWLNENANRFTYKPNEDGKNGFKFQDIIDGITLIMDFSLPEAMLEFDNVIDGENYDYYSIQYIGKAKFDHAKGWYDSDRVDPSHFIYHKTYKEMIVNEVFEPIIEYCNTYFKSENSLYLIFYTFGTEGFIAPTDESIASNKYPKLKMLRRLKQKSIF